MASTPDTASSMCEQCCIDRQAVSLPEINHEMVHINFAISVCQRSEPGLEGNATAVSAFACLADLILALELDRPEVKQVA